MKHHPTDVYEILREVSMSYGVDRLAVHMGTPKGTLYNKLNLNDSSQQHKPTLADFTQIMAVTKNTEPLQALCALFGGVFYELPDLSRFADDALLEIVNRLHVQGGEAHKVMSDALEDGVITVAEAKAFKEACQQWLAAILELRARFVSLTVNVTPSR